MAINRPLRVDISWLIAHTEFKRRNTMKFSELKGRAVVSLEDAKKRGEVQDLMIEPSSRRIISLKVNNGLFHAARLVPAADVKNVGADAVTISASTDPANIPADAASSNRYDAGQEK